MPNLFEPYRDFSAPSFVYFAGEAVPDAAAREEAGRQQFEADFNLVAPYVSNGKTLPLPRDVLDTPLSRQIRSDLLRYQDYLNSSQIAVIADFAERYHPTEYQEAIQKYVDGITEKTESDLKADLVNRSTLSYKAFYDRAIHRLTVEIENESRTTETRVEAIRDWTKTELNLLKEQVEANRNTSIKKAALGKAKTTVRDAVPGEDKAPSYPKEKSAFGVLKMFHSLDYTQYLKNRNDAQELFDDYVNALNIQYIHPDREERNLIDRTGEDRGEDYFDTYEDLADRFKDGMAERVKAKVELIFFEGATPEKLKALQESIANEYTAIAGRGDGEQNDFTFADLTAMGEAEKQAFDPELLIHQDTMDETMIDKVDRQHMMLPEVLIKTSKAHAEILIETAVKNGNSAGVINFVKEYYKSLGPDRELKEEITFGKAEKEVIKIVERAAKAGARETFPILQKLESLANSAFTEALADVDPRIHDRTLKERQKLLLGEHWPKNEPDRRVLAFMMANRDKRERILQSDVERNALFEGIKIATVDYEAALKKLLPGGGSQKITGGAAREPARLQALVLLGKEAEAIVKNFGKEYETAYEEAKESLADNPPYPIDLDFGTLDDKVSARYISRAELGGFNGTDLGYGLVKVWAGATFLLNARKSGFKFMHRNPYVWASAAVFGGVHYGEKMPGGPIAYMKASKAQKEFKVTHLKLDDICDADDLNHEYVSAFCHNNREFKAIASIVKEKGTFQRLVKQAEERAGKEKDPEKRKPVITFEDIATLEGVEDAKHLGRIVSHHPAEARARYEFYKRFLAGQEGTRNLDKLESDCRQF